MTHHEQHRQHHPGIADPTRFLGRILHLDDAVAWSRPALTSSSADGSRSRLTYGELAGSVGSVGRALASMGVLPGDRVALVAPYRPDWVAAFLGILAYGAVAVPLDPDLAAPEVAPLLRDADPTAVLYGTGNEDGVRAALEVAGIAVLAQALAAAAGAASLRDVSPVPRRPGDPAVIAYTSGTTGGPKGVTISWANLAYQVATAVRCQRAVAVASFVSVLPAHHMLELTAGCLGPLFAGGRVHYPGSILAADLASAVAEHRATDLVVVPLVLTALKRRFESEMAQATGIRRAALLARRHVAARLPFPLRRLVLRPLHARLGGRLRRFLVGGAPLDRDLAAYFRRLGFHVCHGYGLTEASPIVSANTPWEHRSGSSGRALPGTEVRVGPDGEIFVRGPGVMLGYWGRPELTAATVDGEGWLRTGDIGFVDRDGYLFVTGRAKELIVLPSGENVQPEELESAVRRSRLVGDVCALGGQGPRGEEVVVVVTASERARAGVADPAGREQALKGEVRRLTSGLAPYKRPSRIVVHDGELPQTPTRKVKRAEVRELLRSMQA